MKPRGALQPTNFGTKQSKTPSSQGISGGSADLDNELFAAMQQWDDDNGALGFVEEGFEDCVMEGGATPEEVGDNNEAAEGYQVANVKKSSSSSSRD